MNEGISWVVGVYKRGGSACHRNVTALPFFSEIQGYNYQYGRMLNSPVSALISGRPAEATG